MYRYKIEHEICIKSFAPITHEDPNVTRHTENFTSEGLRGVLRAIAGVELGATRTYENGHITVTTHVYGKEAAGSDWVLLSPADLIPPKEAPRPIVYVDDEYGCLRANA